LLEGRGRILTGKHEIRKGRKPGTEWEVKFMF
jgi:hypothetical protein